MAGMPRIVVPGYPHHVTQRGNRRQKTFFCDDDYRYYIENHQADSIRRNTRTGRPPAGQSRVYRQPGAINWQATGPQTPRPQTIKTQIGILSPELSDDI